MAAKADWGRRVRDEAWAFGRKLRDDLLRDYQGEYGVAIPPPPARIVDELLTDFLGQTCSTWLWRVTDSPRPRGRTAGRWFG